MTDAPTYVKQEKCSSRHRWLIGTFLFIAVSVGDLLTWAIATASEVSGDLRVHVEVQLERDKHLKVTLDEIKVDLKEVLDIARNGK